MQSHVGISSISIYRSIRVQTLKNRPRDVIVRLKPSSHKSHEQSQMKHHIARRNVIT